MLNLINNIIPQSLGEQYCGQCKKCKLENGGDCAIQQGENPAGIQGTTQVTGEIKAGQKYRLIHRYV